MASNGSRRVLYIQYANPSAYPSLQHSSRLLADMGWRVMFLGISAAEDDVLRFPDHERISIRQLSFCPPSLRQKLHYLWFFLWALGWTLRWRPQWMYASDPLVCPIALLLTFLPRLRIIYHEHDSPDGSTTSLFLQLCLWARQKLAQRAEIRVLPNQQRAGLFSTEVANGEQVFCIWNCPQKDEVRPARSPRKNDRMIVYYHGVIGSSYISLSVLQAMAMLPDGVRLEVIGYETVGTMGYSNYLKEEVRRLSIQDRVQLLGPMPRHQALEYCSQCDVGLALIPTRSEDVNNVYKIGASNKPFDFLACGLALLVSDKPDWIATYVQPGYGLACDPDNPVSIASTLRWFLVHPLEMRAMGERGRQRILTEWNYEQQFFPVLEQLNGKMR